MKGKFLLMILVSLFFFSCKKDKQSCSDGIFDSEKEEKTDCGGVCPPCDFQPTSVDTYLSVKVNGKAVSFSEYSIVKSSVWMLYFENDSLNVQLNLGDGDSLGGRPIEVIGSQAEYKFLNYPTLHNGLSVFSNVDHSENKLSAYFEAKLFALNNIDTLFLTDGEFQNISW